MTPEELEILDQLEKKATKNWQAGEYDDEKDYTPIYEMGQHLTTEPMSHVATVYSEDDNVKLIVLLRNNARELIDAIKERDQLKKQLSYINEQFAMSAGILLALHDTITDWPLYNELRKYTTNDKT